MGPRAVESPRAVSYSPNKSGRPSPDWFLVVAVSRSSPLCDGIRPPSTCACLSLTPWKFVFRTLDVVADESDFYDGIGQIARANMLQCCGEKLALLPCGDVRKDDGPTSVQGFLAVEIKKVGAIVGDERVLLLPRVGFHAARLAAPAKLIWSASAAALFPQQRRAAPHLGAF